MVHCKCRKTSRSWSVVVAEVLLKFWPKLAINFPEMMWTYFYLIFGHLPAKMTVDKESG